MLSAALPRLRARFTKRKRLNDIQEARLAAFDISDATGLLFNVEHPVVHADTRMPSSTSDTGGRRSYANELLHLDLISDVPQDP